MKIYKYSKKKCFKRRNSFFKKFMILWFLGLWSVICHSQEVTKQLTFKRSDCGVRRGITCSTNQKSTQTIEVANSLFTMTIEGSLTVTISRKHITTKEEKLLFGTVITRENKEGLRFTLDQRDQYPDDVLALLPEQIRSAPLFLEAGSYPTQITSTSIIITLIEKL